MRMRKRRMDARKRIAGTALSSFRLEIARIAKNRYQRHLWCQGDGESRGGLDSRGVLSREANAHGLRCPQDFSFELVRHDPAGVRVVAPQTLREASNRDEFVHHADTRLGLPVSQSPVPHRVRSGSF